MTTEDVVSKGDPFSMYSNLKMIGQGYAPTTLSLSLSLATLSVSLADRFALIVLLAPYFLLPRMLPAKPYVHLLVSEHRPLAHVRMHS